MTRAGRTGAVRHGLGAGIALGLAAGAAAAAPLHHTLFALPTALPEELCAALLRLGVQLRLPVSRTLAMLLIHAVAAGVVGAAVGAAMAQIDRPWAARLSRARWLGPLFALGAVFLMAWIWSRRSVAGSALALLLLGGGLAMWTAAVGEAVAAVLGVLRARPLVPAVAGIVLAAGCVATASRTPRLAEVEGAAAGKPAVPVLLIGVDAAAWANLDPAIREGRLPTFAALERRGTRGDLESFLPMYSPIIWTTMATGVGPDRHGIRGFSVDGVPYSSNSRTAFAFWEILPRYGLRSAVGMWWASWPAEPVEGLIVSERFLDGGLPHRVHPEIERPRLEALADEARAAAPEVEDVVAADGSAGLSEAFRSRHREKLRVLARFLDRDEFATRLGEATLGSGEFDLVVAYLRGPDAVGHKFWRWHYERGWPRLARTLYGEPDADLAALGPVVERMNDRVDTQLRRLLEAAGEPVNVVIVSDHGMTAFAPSSAEAEAETGNHHRAGLVLLSGPAFRSEARVHGASVYDVLPTVLYLLDLPVPADLPGRVLEEAIDSEWAGAHPLRRIASFGPKETGDTTPVPTQADDDVLEELRALGYVVD